MSAAPSLSVSYSCRSKYSGILYRFEARNVASITDEPYPPGGTLRVLRNAAGHILAGPLVEELVEFRVAS